jgi:hypothetical protein
VIGEIEKAGDGGTYHLALALPYFPTRISIFKMDSPQHNHYTLSKDSVNVLIAYSCQRISMKIAQDSI